MSVQDLIEAKIKEARKSGKLQKTYKKLSDFFNRHVRGYNRDDFCDIHCVYTRDMPCRYCEEDEKDFDLAFSHEKQINS